MAYTKNGYGRIKFIENIVKNRPKIKVLPVLSVRGNIIYFMLIFSFYI